MNLRTILSFIAFTFLFGAFGQNQSAIDSLKNILRTAKEDTSKVNCLIDLSSRYGRTSDYTTAMQYADSALALATTLDYKKGIAESNKYLGNCNEFQGNGPQALEHFSAALKAFEEIGDKSAAGFIYTNIGITYQNMGNEPKALENWFTALKIFEEIGDKQGITWSYNGVGSVYMGMFNYPEAIKHYTAALKSAEEIGDKKGIVSSHIRIGHFNLNQGNYEEALEDYWTALKICEEIGSRIDASVCNHNIGWIYWDLENYHEAIEYFQASLKITEEIGYDGLNLSNYNCIADLYIILNNYQEARKYLDDRLAYAKERGHKWGIVNSYIKIGDLYQKQGKFQEAIKHLEDGLAFSKESGDKNGTVNLCINIANVYQKQGNYQEARKYLEEGLALSEEIGNKNQIKLIYKQLSELNNAEGKLEQALEHYKMFTLYKDSLRDEENESKLEEMMIQYETEKKDREIELLNKDKELQEQELDKQGLIRNGTIGGAGLLMLVGLLFFRSFRLRKKLEKQQAIIQERHRISTDLHDDVGSGLSKITLLSELLKTQAKTPENRKEAEKISATALELSSTISEIIWALNSNNDYLENMLAYIRRYAAEYFENSPVNLKIITSGEILPTPINGEHRRNLFYSVKEALNNILKHAEATEAELKFVVIDDKLDVIISDNGKGIPDGDLNLFGNGIKNMRARMKSIRGDFKIESHEGTKITMNLAI